MLYSFRRLSQLSSVLRDRPDIQQVRRLLVRIRGERGACHWFDQKGTSITHLLGDWVDLVEQSESLVHDPREVRLVLPIEFRLEYPCSEAQIGIGRSARHLYDTFVDTHVD